MEDVFSSPTQLKGMVKVKALKLLAVHRLKRYSGFAEWMSKANFDNFVIQPEGILFSSSFDPVFGQQHVLLTYKELKPYLKNKNIYKHFRKFK